MRMYLALARWTHDAIERGNRGGNALLWTALADEADDEKVLFADLKQAEKVAFTFKKELADTVDTRVQAIEVPD